MTRDEIHQNFIRFMEQARHEHEMTIPRMAAYLGITEEKYKNIIYNKSQCIDISIACRLYDLTGKWMWQMTGYKTSESGVINKYLALSDRDKQLIRGIADLMSDKEV